MHKLSNHMPFLTFKVTDSPGIEHIKGTQIFTIEFVLLDFSLSVKTATLIFISGRGLAISSAKEGKSGSIYKMVKNK